MTGHRTAPGFSALALVETYWDALRGKALLPDRADIDPRGIETALEYAFIAERTSRGAMFRVAGTHLVSLMGADMRRAPMSDLFREDERSKFATLVSEVCAMPAICTLRLRGEGGAGRRILDARMNLLPLRGDTGRVERLLGCVVALGEIGAAPRRFVILDRMMERIQLQAPAADMANVGSGRAISHESTGISGAGFEAPNTAFDRAGAPPPRRPHLRLVKTDE